jgi:acetyl-CoA acetyltransferase
MRAAIELEIVIFAELYRSASDLYLLAEGFPTVDQATERGLKALRRGLRLAQRARAEIMLALGPESISEAEAEIRQLDRLISCATLGLSRLPNDPNERLRHIHETLRAVEHLCGDPD